MLKYSTINPSSLTQMITPDLPISVVIDKVEQLFDISNGSEMLDIPYFFLGMNTGLSIINNNHTTITRSWIKYHQSQTDVSKYAGFLLGLGLNGYLKIVPLTDLIKYLDLSDLSRIAVY